MKNIKLLLTLLAFTTFSNAEKVTFLQEESFDLKVEKYESPIDVFYGIFEDQENDVVFKSVFELPARMSMIDFNIDFETWRKMQDKDNYSDENAFMEAFKKHKSAFESYEDYKKMDFVNDSEKIIGQALLSFSEDKSYLIIYVESEKRNRTVLFTYAENGTLVKRKPPNEMKEFLFRFTDFSSVTELVKKRFAVKSKNGFFRPLEIDKNSILHKDIDQR